MACGPALLPLREMKLDMWCQLAAESTSIARGSHPFRLLVAVSAAVQARVGAGPSAAATALLARRKVTGRWTPAGMSTRMHLKTGRLREWRVKRCSSAAASLAALLT